MNEIPLIKTLNTKLHEKEAEKSSPLAPGIQYQQYELNVDGKTSTVNIPLREAVRFESYIVETNGSVTRKMLKSLLREFRGIRG